MNTLNTASAANTIDHSALIIDIISGCDGFEIHNAPVEDLWTHTWSPVPFTMETEGSPVVTFANSKWLGTKRD